MISRFLLALTLLVAPSIAIAQQPTATHPQQRDTTRQADTTKAKTGKRVARPGTDTTKSKKTAADTSKKTAVDTTKKTTTDTTKPK